MKSTATKQQKKAKPQLKVPLDDALTSLKRLATKATLDGMTRYAIPSDNAIGVTVGDIRKVAKRLGKSHDLAAALWETGMYEARMLASFVDDPKCVTPAQMEHWSRDFDSWAICDTVCFHLFDRTPHAWQKIAVWSRRKDEFVRRAAFALLASCTVHDKGAADEQFMQGLTFVERAATDERNFVKKAVNWALRSIGKRNATLHAAAVSVAQRLAESTNPTARWVGKDALRELQGASVSKRLARKKKPTRVAKKRP